MKIKALHISISDGQGGAAIAAYRLHTAMNETTSLASKMLVLVKNTDDQHTVLLSFFQIQRARAANLINNFLGRSKKCSGLFSFALIGNQLNKSRFVQEADVIYIHWVNNGMMSWSDIEKMFALQKPVFLFGHDMWYFSGGCHQSNGCEQYKTNCSNCPFFEGRWFKKKIHDNFIIKREAFLKYKNVVQILPSSDFYTKAISSNIIDQNRVRFLSNMLDTQKFKPGHYVPSTHPRKVLYGAMGGKSNPYKGWDDFVFFATHITQKYGNDVEVLLFGYDFKPSELSDLPFQAKSYGIINKEDQIIKMYQEVDVFVFPSYQESFGQTLFEAMSCGVVPIAYKVGIAPDLIEDGTNGFLVNLRDREGLVTAFDSLMGLSIENIKIAARASIEKNFSKEIILNKHLALIKSML